MLYLSREGRHVFRGSDRQAGTQEVPMCRPPCLVLQSWSESHCMITGFSPESVS